MRESIKWILNVGEISHLFFRYKIEKSDGNFYLGKISEKFLRVTSHRIIFS